MLRSILFWILAFVITAGSAVFQRKTGPTWPVDGEVSFANSIIKYEFERAHEGKTDHKVEIEVLDKNIGGILYYKRFKTADDWTSVTMTRKENNLTGFLPHQPPAGKLLYYVELNSNSSKLSIPEKGPIQIRYKDEVPLSIILIHVFFMFAAMLVSTKAGIQVLIKGENIRKYAIWTAALMFIGGFILGPIMQKFAFGDYWTGFPFGFDLTDNKTLIAMIAWVIALIKGRNDQKADGWVLAASIITFVIFMIPHSMLGSEFDYSQLPNGQ
ncbi:hypothetical protein ACFL4T_07190 [candidate division KSB1 bacterium]